MASSEGPTEAVRSPENGGLLIVRFPFDSRDLEALRGPPEAFRPEGFPLGPTYGVQNHLALEVVAHLAEGGGEIQFQGGTALQVKLQNRTRFSIDVDIKCGSLEDVEQNLREFAGRFPYSDVTLVEPPGDLKVDGVRHTLLFPKAADPGDGQPLMILVEAVPSEDTLRGTEPLRLEVDDFDWGCSVPAPSLEGFAVQKFAVLGPTTIGKPLGRNETHARQNQGVCKQIHDLGQLMKHEVDGEHVRKLYPTQVDEANRLRRTEHSVEAVLKDAGNLLEHLREPRPAAKEPLLAYALWSGYGDSQRWVRDRHEWTPGNYRTTGGVLQRMVTELQSDRLRWDLIARPVREDPPDEELVNRLDEAVNQPAEWVPDDRFGGDVRAAWAWSPEELWQ